MEYSAIHRFARISPYKVRRVMDLVRGKQVNEALEILRFSPKRAAVMIDKVVKSAIANASQNVEVDINRLMVIEARVDGGPLAQGRLRWRPGPRGMANPIRKRTSHILIKLKEMGKSEEETEKG